MNKQFKIDGKLRISLILFILAISISVYFIYSIYQFKPMVAMVILTVVILLFIVMYLISRKTIRITIVIQIILCILLGICSIAVHKLNTITDKIIDTVEYETIQIVAKADSKINQSSDFTALEMVYNKSDITGYENAKELLKEHNIVLKNAMPEDTTKKSYDLLSDGKTDLMVLTSIGRSKLEEDISNLDSKIKVIFEKKIKMKEAKAKHVDITKEPFTLYICGTDLSGIKNVNATGRGDVNILLTINPQTQKVNLQVIPRDLFVYIPVKDASSKLSYSGWWGGIESSIASIENALNIEINYYVKMNFTGLSDLVDSLGGVKVYSHYTYTVGGYPFVEGYNEVDGKQALAFARERKSLPLNERSRGYQQMELIKAIFTKFGEDPSYEHALAVIDSISNNFTTNLPKEDFYDACMLVVDMLPQLKEMEPHSMEGDYVWHMDEVITSDYLYYFEPAKGEIEKAKERINQILNG